MTSDKDLPAVFILTAGTVGDLYPLLRVALALQKRGHAVTLLGPEIHAHHVQQAGVTFTSIISTADYLEIMNNPDVWHARKGVGVILRGLQRGTEQLDNIIKMLPQHERCIMLTHPLAVPAAAMARAVRPAVRVVTFYLAPSNLRSVHDPLTMGPLAIPRWVPARMRRWLWRRIDANMVDPIALPNLNAERLSRGLPPLQHYFEHMYGVGDLSITLFPEWFATTPPDWPQPLHSAYFQLYDPLQGQDLPAPLREFLDTGEAPIVFTPGSGNRHANEFFEQAMLCAEKLCRRAIFLTPYREQVPAALPASVLWQDYVPISGLLPFVAALVHHGGIGTTAEALRAGVPQLVVPLAFDQFDNAARVCALGVGASISIAAARRGKMTKNLHILLSSQAVREGCRAVASQFAKPDDEEALCRAILSA